jgi:DNA (cytosine-5)-methyltransferase 1
MKSAIDFYSGIGGWTLGMKLSGIQNVASYEWWQEANNTHNINFGTNHDEIDIRKINVITDLDFGRKIDFVVGSPPCTQFSFANRGGNGNLADGLIDLYKFLEIVDFLKPKYWAMENVPRVAKILEQELNGSLKKFKHLVKVIKVVDASDYGVPQSRKRMIAGDFPFELFESYKKGIKKKTLGEVIKTLSQTVITDPNYGYKIKREDVTELDNEVDLTIEEERINKDSKTYHPVYNGMSFPENLEKPSRTITATCTRVSRESIILKSDKGFRRLNVRERGVLQGFPITYQFYGKTLNAKFKMIGNAVPPVLTYYIFQSMLGTKTKDLKNPAQSSYQHKKPKQAAPISKLDLPLRKFPRARKFQFAVPNLRFGSGIRFELSNNSSEFNIEWSFKFYYGNSKAIKQVTLDQKLLNNLNEFLDDNTKIIINRHVDKIVSKYEDLNSRYLQELWTSSKRSYKVIEFIDQVGNAASQLLAKPEIRALATHEMPGFLPAFNKSIVKEVPKIVLGCFLLSSLNEQIFIHENSSVLFAS